MKQVHWGRIRTVALYCAGIILALAGIPAQAEGIGVSTPTAEVPPEARAAVEQYMQGESVFIKNLGQWPEADIDYALDGHGANVGMTSTGLRFQMFRQVSASASDSLDTSDMPPASERHDFNIVFEGAQAVDPAGRDHSDRTYNYQIGDPALHRDHVPSFETVWYEGLYPGIDLEVSGKRTGVKYNFHVQPGADWRNIRLHYEGVQSISQNLDGSLQLALRDEWPALTDPAPYVYQERAGKRITVAAKFVILDAHTSGFEITGDYDETLPLVIDPAVAWSTYLGGTGDDYGFGIAVDSSGNAYATGYTESTGWASGGFDTSHNGSRDSYVVKLSAAGAHLWSTYLGGTGADEGYGIAIDSSGNAYATGYSQSAGWVSGGFDTSNNGVRDGYVVKLSPSGAHIWSTYMGGTGDDFGYGIALDSSGNAYVAGETISAGWTSGGFDTSHNAWIDGYVVKLSAAGTHLWSTYLGSTSDEYAYGIAVDSSGNAYVTGFSWNDSAAWMSGGFDTSPNGGFDGYVVKLSAAGAHLWSTYLGGTNNDSGRSIAVDSSGNAYATGYTTSTGWAAGGFDTSYNGAGDGYVVKLSTAGAHLWSTYLGGTSGDNGDGIALDSSGNAYATGYTDSTGWASGGFDTSYNGGGADGYVVKLDPAGAHLWSTYLGGTGTEYGRSIAVDSSESVYVTGLTQSAAWMSGGFDTSYNGAWDGYVMKIVEDSTPPNAITITPSTTGPTNADDISFTVTFDEDVQNFANPTDLIVTHSGTASGGFTFSGGPSVYTVTITGILGDGSFTIGVNTGSDVQDLAGNPLASSVTSAAVTIDNTAPTITLSSAAGDPVNGAITVNVLLSEASVNFTALDISPINATVSGGSGGGTTYSFTLTPLTDGVFSAEVLAGVFTDAATNGNSASNLLSRTADLTDPTITLSSAAGNPVIGAITVDVVLSEVSTDFIDTDINPTNASVSGFSGSGTSYSFTLTPLTDGAFSAQVNAGTFSDAVGNTNTAASNILSRLADLTSPSFSNFTATPSQALSGGTVTITFDTSEGLQADPMVTVNTNVATFVSLVGSTYTYSYTVSSDPLGAATIEASGMDIYGNLGVTPNATALEIIDVPSVPLAAWPGLVALAAAGAMVLRKRKK